MSEEPQDKNAYIDENEICIRILKVNEAVVCVEFTNLNGPQLSFLNAYNRIKQMLDMTNDTPLDFTEA